MLFCPEGKSQYYDFRAAPTFPSQGKGRNEGIKTSFFLILNPLNNCLSQHALQVSPQQERKKLKRFQKLAKALFTICICS